MLGPAVPGSVPLVAGIDCPTAQAMFEVAPDTFQTAVDDADVGDCFQYARYDMYYALFVHPQVEIVFQVQIHRNLLGMKMQACTVLVSFGHRRIGEIDTLLIHMNHCLQAAYHQNYLVVELLYGCNPLEKILVPTDSNHMFA